MIPSDRAEPSGSRHQTNGRAAPVDAVPMVLLALAILGFLNFLDYASRALVNPRGIAVALAILSGLVLIFLLFLWKRKKIGVVGFVLSIILSFSLKIVLNEQIGFSFWEPLSLPVLAATLKTDWLNWK